MHFGLSLFLFSLWHDSEYISGPVASVLHIKSARLCLHKQCKGKEQNLHTAAARSKDGQSQLIFQNTRRWMNTVNKVYDVKPNPQKELNSHFCLSWGNILVDDTVLPLSSDCSSQERMDARQGTSNGAGKKRNKRKQITGIQSFIKAKQTEICSKIAGRLKGGPLKSQANSRPPAALRSAPAGASALPFWI